MRAWNSSGTAEASGGWWTFTTAAPAAPPGAFAKTAPGSGATGQATSVTLTWAASSDATTYEDRYDTTSNGACNSYLAERGDGADRDRERADREHRLFVAGAGDQQRWINGRVGRVVGIHDGGAAGHRDEADAR